MTKESAVVIKLRSQRGTWVFVSLAVGSLGIFALVLGGGTLLAEGFGTSERLVLGVGGLIAGIFLLAGACLGLLVARAAPELKVASGSVTLRHSGLLRRPLVVSRKDVGEVFINEHAGTQSSGLDLRASSELLPDFSTPIGSPARRSNLLLVFHSEVVLDVPRRGLAAIAFIADRFSGYSGPSRGAVINGFLCEAEDASAARRAFGTWGVLVEEPSQRALSRIGPDEARRRMNRRR